MASPEHLDSAMAEPGQKGANRFHLGLKAIPSGFLLLAPKNLKPYKKVIGIMAITTQEQKIFISCGLTVAGSGDVSVTITGLSVKVLLSGMHLLVNVTASPLVWAINRP